MQTGVLHLRMLARHAQGPQHMQRLPCPHCPAHVVALSILLLGCFCDACSRISGQEEVLRTAIMASKANLMKLQVCAAQQQRLCSSMTHM